MTISFEQPVHAASIERLLDDSFGPDRLSKTAYRLREGVAPVDGLSLVSLDAATGALDGTIRFWPILIGGAVPSLLLGPIAIAADKRGTGIGGALIRTGVARAAALGWRSVLLVGDAPYYSRFGFTRELTRGMLMPGPVDYDRLLGLELVPGALAGVTGMIGPWVEPAAPGPAGLSWPGAAVLEAMPATA
jgi:predicted N-acetyltransferase YhbS